MRRFDRLLIAIPLLFLLVITVTDIILLRNEGADKQYIVDANRIEQQLLSGEAPAADEFPSVTSIEKYDGSEGFFRSSGEYLIREVNGELYRIGYTDKDTSPHIGTAIAKHSTTRATIINRFRMLLSAITGSQAK